MGTIEPKSAAHHTQLRSLRRRREPLRLGSSPREHNRFVNTTQLAQAGCQQCHRQQTAKHPSRPSAVGLTRKFSSGAGCKDFVSRKSRNAGLVSCNAWFGMPYDRNQDYLYT
jgi:hypothetical protein